MKSWHEHLVRRPDLSAPATIKLSSFVAHSLAEVLETADEARSAADAAGPATTVVPEVLTATEEPNSRGAAGCSPSSG